MIWLLGWFIITDIVLIFNLCDFNSYWWLIILWIIGNIFFGQKYQKRLLIKNWKRFSFICLMGFLLILRSVWVIYFDPQINNNHLQTKHWINVTVNKIQNKQIIIKHQKKYYLLYNWKIQTNINRNDELQFCGNFNFLTLQKKNKGFYWWSRSQQISGIIFAQNNCQQKIIPAKNLSNRIQTWLLKNTSKRVKFWIQWWLFQNINEPKSKNSLWRKTQNLGVAHLFITSGFHLIISSSLLWYLIQKISNRKGKQILQVILILWISAIVYLTGFKITTVKAWLLIILNIFFRNEGMKRSGKLILIALIFIFYWPLIIFNIGIQISFIASYLIGIYTPNQKNWFLKLKTFILKNLLITFAIIPIIIGWQQQISLLIVFNLTILSIWITILYSGFFLTIWIKPWLFIWDYLFGITTQIINFLDQINWTWKLNNLTTYANLIYYLIWLIFLIFRQQTTKWFLVLQLLLILIINNLVLRWEPHAHLHIIDVRHGLAMLLHTPNNEKILLDAGIGKKQQSRSLIILKYLRKWNISHLNAVFISHDDSDHFNNLQFLKEQIKIDKIYTFKDPKFIYQIGTQIFYNLNYQNLINETKIITVV